MATRTRHRRSDRRQYPPPGDVPDGHPGLTLRVLEAVARAQLQHDSHLVTDEDGPHSHHWEAILYRCRGCGAFEDSKGRRR